MNWFISYLHKYARRFKPQDRVRYFTRGLKGKGKGIVVSPYSARGTVVDYNPNVRRYTVLDEGGENIDVHPRNIVPDVVGRVSEPNIALQ